MRVINLFECFTCRLKFISSNSYISYIRMVSNSVSCKWCKMCNSILLIFLLKCLLQFIVVINNMRWLRINFFVFLLLNLTNSFLRNWLFFRWLWLFLLNFNLLFLFNLGYWFTTENWLTIVDLLANHFNIGLLFHSSWLGNTWFLLLNMHWEFFIWFFYLCISFIDGSILSFFIWCLKHNWSINANHFSLLWPRWIILLKVAQ